MRKLIHVFNTHSDNSAAPDYSFKGELALRIDPNVRNYVVEDKAQGKMWFFPMENVECLAVEDDRRSAEQIDAADDAANDRRPM